MNHLLIARQYVRHHTTVLIRGHLATHMAESHRSPHLPQPIASSRGACRTRYLGHLLGFQAHCFYRKHLGIHLGIAVIILVCHCNLHPLLRRLHGVGLIKIFHRLGHCIEMLVGILVVRQLSIECP